ncbi:MAG TPA: hypothetical protein DDZ80_08105 [Cyanobacteria bacterium UBA8803]|nr:hypothetical protein [Cyanobacteria bacterium UBA9273]HBL58467.1 hypothetical protein [Cyanobacteria bacterium UBA8803]
MKHFGRISRQSKQLIIALVLTIILPLSTGITFLVAKAVYRNLPSTTTVPSNEQSEEIAIPPQEDGNLPDAVVQVVLQDASKRSNLPNQELSIVQAEQRDWPDGCLGLAFSGTFCAQVVVPGWQVIVNAGQRDFVYRTNNSGSQVKLESSNFKNRQEGRK